MEGLTLAERKAVYQAGSRAVRERFEEGRRARSWTSSAHSRGGVAITPERPCALRRGTPVRGGDRPALAPTARTCSGRCAWSGRRSMPHWANASRRSWPRRSLVGELANVRIVD